MRWRLGLFAGAVNAALLVGAALAARSLGELSSVLIIAGAALLAFAEASVQQRDDVVRREPRMLVTALCLMMLLVTGVVSTASGGAPWVGLVLMFSGTALRALAMRTLASDFVSESRPADRLVTHGVYAWLRHPSETGLMAFALGAAVASGAAAAWGWLAALLVASCARLDREEASLRAMLGGAYRAYASRVPALVGLPTPRWARVSDR